MSMNPVPRLHPDDTRVVLIDVQERFAPVIHRFDDCVKRCRILLEATAAMNMKTLITEQYPEGLGKTVSALSGVVADAPVLVKTTFSCFGETAFNTTLNSMNRPGTLVLAGIESHVCVLQTALDGLGLGMSVYIAADCVSSRKAEDRETALHYMNSRGIHVLPLESILFLLLRDSKNPAFRAVSRLVR